MRVDRRPDVTSCDTALIFAISAVLHTHPARCAQHGAEGARHIPIPLSQDLDVVYSTQLGSCVSRTNTGACAKGQGNCASAKRRHPICRRLERRRPELGGIAAPDGMGEMALGRHPRARARRLPHVVQQLTAVALPALDSSLRPNAHVSPPRHSSCTCGGQRGRQVGRWCCRGYEVVQCASL